jgi:translation initiation factor 5B
MHAANGLKIAATGLDEAVAGTPLFVCKSQEEVEEAMIICNDEFDNIKKKIKLENLGVGVAASTLGSLEALLEYLNSQKVPVSYITVGPVSKDDVMKAMKSVLS